MKQIKTSSGFEVEVNENVVDDIAFLDLICELDEGHPRAIRKIIDMLLSKTDSKRLFAHVKTADGRVPVSALNVEITDIIKGIGKK